jgi:hypothetical protein
MLPESAVVAALVVALPSWQQDPEIGITIHLRTEVSADALFTARQHVARIFAAAGIGVEWHEPGRSSSCSAGHPELQVGLVEKAERKRQVQDGAMGLAIPGPTLAGALAYIFFDSVHRTARTNHLDPAAMLGHAMAHELGHLLLPYGSHSPNGLMRARWQTRDFKALTDQRLLFSAEESGVMKARLRVVD